jgi:tungstate transport system permease protein
VAETIILDIAALSLFVSGTATLLSAAVGVPLGTWLGEREFRGRRFLRAALHGLYGLPPVLLGLLLFLMLSRTGPLGPLRWLYTAHGMILAQFLLTLPFVVGLTWNAVGGVDPAVRDTARTLGAEGRQHLWALVREARLGILGAVMVAFGRAISEVGAVIIVGGNIQGETEVLTTAIVKETGQGHFDVAIGLGLILISLSMIVFATLTLLQEREK